jgi:hypothetical protein
LGFVGRLAICEVVLGALAVSADTTAFSQPASSDVATAPTEDDSFEIPAIALHGFVSQGAFVSTDNDYLGHSERGSFEFLEAAVNISSEVTDRLRVGAQLFTRDLGPIGNYALSLDWAYLDYRLRDWLGLRAGRIKIPFGMYNEFIDVDAARVQILPPQSVYSIRNRDILLAHAGFSLYGSAPLGGAGALDYNAYAGALFVDPTSSALVVVGPVELDAVDTKYVAGGQLFWRTPLHGLRVGGSFLHSNLAFHFSVDTLTSMQLVATGMVPDDFDGAFTYGYRDINLGIGSAEYTIADWTFSAEYSRQTFRIYSTIPTVFPGTDIDSEGLYGMASRRLTDWIEAGAYYSLFFADADDRDGSGERFTESHRAYQRDLAVTARFDINDFWLWKLEGHYMDGTGDLIDDDPADPDNLASQWGFFLVKTTLTF